MKLGAKCFELVQKFVARRRVGVFRYEHTRSTTLDPKHMFWIVSYHLCAFGIVRSKLGAKHSELVQKFVRRGPIGIFHDERTQSTHWTLISCFGAFHTIWVHLGPFCCLTKLGAKWAELVQSSCHEFASEFFAINAPDRPHWTLN